MSDSLNQKYTISFQAETKGVIDKLKEIRNAMANMTTNTSIFKNVDKEFEKYNNLMTELAALEPFKDTVKGGTEYIKVLNKASLSVGKIGELLKNIGQNSDRAFEFKSLAAVEGYVNKAQKKISDLNKTLVEAKRLLKDPMKDMNFNSVVIKQIDNEQKLIDKLKQEYELRKSSYDIEVKKALDTAKTDAATKSYATESGMVKTIQNGKKTYGIDALGNNITSQAKAKDALNEIIKKQIQALQVGESYESLWQRINAQMTQQGIQINNQTTIANSIKKQYDLIQNSVNNAASELKHNMELIGTQGTNGKLVFSQTAEAAIQAAKNIQIINENIQKEQQGLNQVAATEERRTQAANARLASASSGTAQLTSQIQENINKEQQLTDKLIEQRQEQDRIGESVKKMQTWLTNILSLTNAWRKFNQIIRKTFSDVQRLDKAFASIAMVTDKTVAGLWETYGEYADMANRLGQTTESAIKASALFYQQGLDTAEALKLTEDTMKLATLAGADFETATKQMTAALRGFHMEMSEGAHVTDVYSELAAKAAADVNGIAYAMSKTASIASSAGMSFETTAAFLTNMIETTQEAPENIGTAMKTIIARFTELKENVSAADSEFDDLDYNKVDKALKSIGISIKDAQGQFRNLDEVFLELSSRWDTLDRNTQRYIATIAAGSRQQSRFIAMMEDYDRTMELVETAQDSAGRSSEQFAKYQDTVEYKLNQLKNTWEQLRVTIVDSDIFKSVIDSLTKELKNLSKLNLKRLIPIVAIISPMIKTTIKTFTDGLTKSGQAFSQAGQLLGKKFNDGFALAGAGLSKKIFGLDPQVIESGIKNTKEKLMEIQQKKEEISSKKIQIQADITNAQMELEKLQAQLTQTPGNPATIAQIKQLNGQISASSEVLKNYEKELSVVSTKENRASNELARLSEYQKKTTAMTSGLTTGLTQVGSAATIMATALISGADAATVLKAGLGSLAVSGINALLQMIPQAISALIAKQNAMKASARVAVATSGVEKAAARASADAAKTAAAESNAALASTGIGLAVIAITAAIAGLGLAIGNLIERSKEAKKTFGEQLNDAKKSLEEIEHLTETKETSAKESKETAEETEKLIDRYDELNSKLIKTTDEQEEWKELILKINETFPEIVQSYDEANQKITIQRDLWKEILDLQKKEALEQKKNASIATAASIGQKRRTAELKAAATPEQLEERYGLSRKAGLFGSQNFQGAIVGAQRMQGENSETYIRRVANEYGTDIQSISESFGYGNGPQTEAEWDKLLGELRNTSSEGWEKISSIVENIEKNAKDAYNKEMKYYDELEKQNLSSILQQSGESENISNFIATGAQNYKTRNIGRLDLKTVATADDINSLKGIERVTTSIAVMHSNDFQKWEDLSSEQKEILSNIGYDNAEAWEKARKNLADNNNFIAQYTEAAYTYNAQKIAETLNTNLEEKDKEIIEEYMSTYTEKTASQINAGKEGIQKIISAASLNREDKNTALNAINDIAKQYESQLSAAKEEISKVLENNNFDNWNLDQLNAYKKLIDDVALSFNSEAAGKKYVQRIHEIFEGIDPTKINQALNSINWDSAKSMGWDEFREDAIQNLDEIGLKGEDIFEEWAKVQRDWGLIHLSIENEEELQEYLDKLDESLKKISDAQNDIVSLNAQIAKGEKINLSDYDKYAKAIEELGLTVSDYLRIDKDGNILADAEKLKTVYAEAYDLQIKSVQEQINNLKNERKEREKSLNLAHLATIEEINQKLQTIEATKAIIEYNRAKLEGQLDQDPQNERIQKNYNRSINQLENINKRIEEIKKDRQIALDEENKRYQQSRSSLNSWEFEATKDLTEKLNELQGRKAAAMHQYEEEYKKELEEQTDAQKNAEKAAEDLAKAQEKVADAMKKVEDALDKIKDKEQDVIDKTNELNKALYGDPLQGNKLDAMYNYKTQLEQMQKLASRAKDSLLNMQSGDNATELLATYMENTHGEIVNRRAQNEIISASIRNYENTLSSKLSSELSALNSTYGANISTNASNYFSKQNGRYAINFQTLNAAALPDEISNYIEEAVETMNNLQNQIDDNIDEIKKKEKELTDLRKGALKRRVDLETQVADILKEKAQEEIDAQKDKYDALKNADQDYLDALEAAIDKQRELRERNKDWDDLATKEKKLSLMQRDTSGANAKEIIELENDIQDNREQLLDQSVDDIINGMREMYELQQESREIELEYQEAMLDSTNWMKQAAAIVDSWKTTEDMVAWMVEQNTETIESASSAQREIMISDWEETGNQMIADTQILTTDLSSLAEASSQEISSTVISTSETLTSQAEFTLAQALEKTNDAIAKAEEALEAAVREVQNARDDYLKALKDLEDARREAEETKIVYDNIMNDISSNSSSISTFSGVNNQDIADRIEYWYNQYNSQLYSRGGSAGITEILNQMKKEGFVYEDNTVKIDTKNGKTEKSIYRDLLDKKIIKDKTNAYATGGIVDYTGLAWVDGTPSKPESFLSAEDTERIGNAARLIANIPLLNGTNITNSSTAGDNLIEVHINIENISSEVDLDNALDKMKNAIWDAAHPAGSSIILR